MYYFENSEASALLTNWNYWNYSIEMNLKSKERGRREEEEKK